MSATTYMLCQPAVSVFFSYDPLVCKINGFNHHSQYLQIMICKHKHHVYLLRIPDRPFYSSNQSSEWQILFCTYSVTYTFLVFPFTQKTKNLLFFSFSVKISIFVSVLKVKQSNALKLAPLPITRLIALYALSISRLKENLSFS